MKRAVLVVLTVAVAGSPALAQTGNGAPSGPHYNLNIIGVEKNEESDDLTGSNRHTIFVALGKNRYRDQPDLSHTGRGVPGL